MYFSKIQQDTNLSPVIQKCLENNKKNNIGYGFTRLLTEKATDLFEKISFKLTHVLLASKLDSQDLINLNKIKYKHLTHISKRDYFDMMIGMVYRRDMNKFVADTFKQV